MIIEASSCSHWSLHRASNIVLRRFVEKNIVIEEIDLNSFNSIIDLATTFVSATSSGFTLV